MMRGRFCRPTSCLALVSLLLVASCDDPGAKNGQISSNVEGFQFDSVYSAFAFLPKEECVGELCGVDWLFVILNDQPDVCENLNNGKLSIGLYGSGQDIANSNFISLIVPGEDILAGDTEVAVPFLVQMDDWCGSASPDGEKVNLSRAMTGSTELSSLSIGQGGRATGAFSYVYHELGWEISGSFDAPYCDFDFEPDRSPGCQRDGDTPITPCKGAACPDIEWIAMGGGSFMMGGQGDNQQPIHAVTVPDFSMAKTEITAAQFDACVQAEVCDMPGEDSNWGQPGQVDHPANDVSWFQARIFCRWVGGRLPSEAEWEYAARSGGQDRVYPWGDEEASCDYAIMSDTDGSGGCQANGTWPVCSKTSGNTDQGLCDMAGNVMEFIEDDYRAAYDCDAFPDAFMCTPGDVAPADGSAWADDSARKHERVFRGGSYHYTAPGLTVSARGSGDPGGPSEFSGFRCVK